MRLLFDENLSPHLVRRLTDIYPGAIHVSTVGLETANDLAVWAFANSNHLTIVTKDADFGDLGHARGFPPKVIWLRLGNCTTREIEHSLRRSHPVVLSFEADTTVGILTLY